MTPNARTLKWLRDNGYEAGIVERRLPHAHTTIDLFGWIDIVAIEGDITIGVQATSDNGGNLSARIKKAEALPAFGDWVRADRIAYFFGWSKRREDRIVKSGKRGTRKVWGCRLVRVHRCESGFVKTTAEWT